MYENKEYICPRCGGMEFYTTILVEQNCRVDRSGNIIKVLKKDSRVVRKPTENDVRICTACSARGVVIEDKTKLDLTKIPLKELDLSMRAFRSLLKLKVANVNDVIGLTYEDLIGIDGVGKITVQEIISKVQVFAPGWSPKRTKKASVRSEKQLAPAQDRPEG